MQCERPIRRWMAAAAILTLALSSTLWAGTATVPSPITFVGTDNNIYYCKRDCATSECLTCPVRGLEVRATGIVDAVMPVTRQEPADYNWPTYSPDGTKLAYVSTGRDQNGPLFGVHVFNCCGSRDVCAPVTAAHQRRVDWRATGSLLARSAMSG